MGGWGCVEGCGCCGHAGSECTWNSSQRIGVGGWGCVKGFRRCRDASSEYVEEGKPGDGGWGCDEAWGGRGVTRGGGGGGASSKFLTPPKMQGLP
jgi:hypothetical protein